MVSSTMCVAHKLIRSGIFVILVAYHHAFVSEATAVQHVNATAGQPAVLPCSLVTPDAITLHNLRFHFQDERHYVLFSFNEGQEMPEHVSGPYQGRIAAFPQDMTRGNISVKILDPSLDDDHRVLKVYASVKKSTGERIYFSEICKIALHVAVPYENVTLVVNEEATMATCNAQRGFPEARVSWKLRTVSDDSGQVEQREGHTTTVQDTGDRLYNLSSTLNIHRGQYLSVTCLIHNPTLNVTLNATLSNKGTQTRGLSDWAVCLMAVLLVKAGITT